jgi:hypothetical protein
MATFSKRVSWNKDKNNLLKLERDISFDEIVDAIFADGLLDVIDHFNQERYPNQFIYVVKWRDYVYLVPFVESEDEIFLKTIIPSRKMKRKYLGD